MCSDIMGVEKYPESDPHVLHQPQCWSENAADSVCLEKERLTHDNYSSNMMFTRYESYKSALGPTTESCSVVLIQLVFGHGLLNLVLCDK